MEKLLHIYDEEISRKIFDNPYYDEDKLCSLIPYICDPYEDPDEIVEAKLSALAIDPEFFFLYGSVVDQVPDVRPFSEETRRGMNIPWFPWLEVERNFTVIREWKRRK